MKLIIDIPDHLYNVIKNKECTNKNVLTKAVENGTPLDDLKTKIETDLSWEMYDEYGNETGLHKELIDILDNIGKESED